MRHTTMLLLSVISVGIASCADTQDQAAKQTDELLQASGLPTANAVAAARNAGNRDTGGKLSADMSGAKSAHTEITDIGYCVIKSYGMEIFALSGNNGDWSVSIAGQRGMPTVGEYTIATVEKQGTYSASVSDKSTGSEPAEWQRYESTAGSVTFTNVTPTMVEGTFTVQATPQGPRTTGAALSVSGTFAAPVAAAC